VSESRPRPPLLATLVATSLGAGFMPKAPGHTGTLTAIPLAYALARCGQSVYLLGFFFICLTGTWAAERFGRATGREDDQRIVIDEVAGYLLTLLFVDRRPFHLLAAFFIFRLFDIWKPPPVRQIDARVRGGIGVMADDLAAGVYGALTMGLVVHFGLLDRLVSSLR
jgi:phosphatidylglycerophosphatase A